MNFQLRGGISNGVNLFTPASASPLTNTLVSKVHRGRAARHGLIKDETQTGLVEGKGGYLRGREIVCSPPLMSNIAEGLDDETSPRLDSVRAQVLDYEYSWRCVCAVLHYTFCLPAAAAAPFSVSPCSSPPPHPRPQPVNQYATAHRALLIFYEPSQPRSRGYARRRASLDDTNLVNCDSIRGKVELRNLDCFFFSCVCVFELYTMKI